MDLNMGTGKIASQTSHAALGAFLKSSKERQEEYHKTGIGTKVCLECPNERKLHEVYDHALSLGLPAEG